MDTLTLSKLCIVEVFFQGEISPTVHYVQHKEVMLLVKALVKLHVKPGYNPHNFASTAPITMIRTKMLSHYNNGRVYWWSSPSLQANWPGAKILHANELRTWRFHSYLDKKNLALSLKQE